MDFHFRHNISFFLLLLFLLRGVGAFMPTAFLHIRQTQPVEFFSETEAENTAKERDEKSCEKEFFTSYRNNLECLVPPVACTTAINQNQANYMQNIFFPVFTPPPNFS